jgi:hypothetical protein
MSRAIYEKRRTALLIVDPYKDATAAFNPEGIEAARVNSLLYAHATLTTNELLAALPRSADGALPDLLLTREIAS